MSVNTIEKDVRVQLAENAHATLTDTTFLQLRDFILEKTGIHLGDGKKYFVELKLGELMAKKGYGSFEEYYYYLRQGMDPREEEDFFDTVTTNETYFFRDPPQLAFFEKEVLPAIRGGVSSGRRYRIWSAAASSGEEAYTMAMIAHNSIPGITGFQLQITGTDISRACLNKAMAGSYPAYAVRLIPESYFQRYFTKRQDEFVVNREVRSLVKFEKANLVEPATMRKYTGMDLIFCKNVFIYFPEPVRKAIAEGFHRSLVPGGCLVLGPSEYLKDFEQLFSCQRLGQCVYYRKI